ncbi:MAG: hypothetical protein JNM39_06595 [Bdellovibrionaceae bacterium]|nr:hypothetical protein [Pseudobdellovibrionaceae bacterium]
MNSKQFYFIGTRILASCAFAVCLTILSTATSRAGGADAGGVGMVRDGDKLKSLAEIGILFEKAAQSIPQYPVCYEIDKETREIVQKYMTILDKKVPGIRGLTEEVLGHRCTFIDQSLIEPATLERIKSEYVGVLKKYNKSLDPALLEFPAYSKDGLTYILPDFKDNNLIAPERKARALIHEHWMRDYPHLAFGERLALALEMDTQVFLLLSTSPEKFDKFDPLPMLAILQQMKRVQPSVLSNSLLLYVQQLIGRPLLLSDLVLDPSDLGKGHYNKTPFHPSLIQKLNLDHGNTNPGLASVFDGATAKYGGKDLIETPAKAITHGTISNGQSMVTSREYVPSVVNEALKKRMDDFCRVNSKYLREPIIQNDAWIFIDHAYDSIRTLAVNCIEGRELEIEGLRY